jgi:hypothetical protein
MRRINKTRLGRRCRHEHTLVVTSVGVRRSVCERCGHISFQMIEPTSNTPAERSDLSKVAGF